MLETNIQYYYQYQLSHFDSLNIDIVIISSNLNWIYVLIDLNFKYTLLRGNIKTNTFGSKPRGTGVFDPSENSKSFNKMAKPI